MMGMHLSAALDGAVSSTADCVPRDCETHHNTYRALMNTCANYYDSCDGSNVSTDRECTGVVWRVAYLQIVLVSAALHPEPLKHYEGESGRTNSHQ